MLPHPGLPSLRVTASPYHLDGRPTHPRGPAAYHVGQQHPSPGPAAYHVGQHTRAVLRDLLGYKDARIAELIAAGTVEGPA